MTAKATFVIDFGNIKDAFLTVELDEVRNNGKTSFSKGDTVHFRISSDVNYEIETTSGTILNGTVDQTEELEAEVISFVKGATASLQKKILNIDSVFWYGNNLGAINAVSATSVQAANANENTLGIASVNYTTEFNEHSIVPPAGMTDIYHIIVYIKAVA